MTQKKATQGDGEEAVTATEEQLPATEAPVLDFRKLYQEQIKAMEQLMALAQKQGITLGEAPPAETAVRVVGTDEWVPTGAGGADANGNDIPWSRHDLNPHDKHNFVPQLIPGLVHPLLDEKRRPRIFFTINGLQACLTVGVLNENISGMFYWAYMNAEEMFVKTELFKEEGPKSAPWTGQGPLGTSTWHHEPQAPSAWIDIEGRYYTAGAPMPITSGAE